MPVRSPARHRLLIAVLACLSSSAALAATAAPAWAHPLGNFTVNTHFGLRVEPAAVAVDAVLDVAEIPTLQAFPDLDDGESLDPADARAYRDRMCPALADAVRLTIDGRPLPLQIVDGAVELVPGSAGLPTTRLACALRTAEPVQTVGHRVVLTDTLVVQPIGWREVTAVGDGVRLESSDVPADSVSDVLRDYPADRIDEPLDQRGATVDVVAGTGVVSGRSVVDREAAGPTGSAGVGADRLTRAFTDLVATSRLSVGFGLFAVLIAAGLGALHALAPGHGKALMAAFLVGREGTLRQAALIGLSVTVTHTVGVLVLGVALSLTLLAAPARVYPWLGLASGVLLVGIGGQLLHTARRGGHGHPHVHEPVPAAVTAGAASAPHRHPHPHDHPHSVQRPEGRRGLLAVGFAGGLVPSPSALVVLLGGIALGRAWFGVLLVLAYGIGMALALVGAGLLVVRLRDTLRRRAQASRSGWSAAPWLTGVLQRLPALTAGVVVLVGVALTVQAGLRI